MSNHTDALSDIVRRVLSVRVRILGWVTLLLVVASVLSISLQNRILVDRLHSETTAAFDQEVEELRSLATGVDPLTGQPFAGDVKRILDVFLDRNVPTGNESFFTFVDGGLYKATTAEDSLADDPALASTWAETNQTSSAEVDTSQGPVRYLAVPLEDSDGTKGVFVVSMLMQEGLDEVGNTTRSAAAVQGIAFVIALILAWFVAGKVLSPVRTITETAQEISESDLGRRIPTGDKNDEIAHLARTFNGMLDRLDQAFSNQRRFLDDIGHELRTPITIVRGNIELESDDPAERERDRRLVLGELDRMARMVNDLLLLARTEEVDFLKPQPVDIDVFTSELVDKSRSIANRNWTLGTIAHGVMMVDPHRLTQAVINLVDNAVRHTSDGDEIEIASLIRNNDVVFAVEDPGPGVPDDKKQAIFERFVRFDAEGTRSGSAGLGLSIVTAVASAHGGRASVKDRPGGGSIFELAIPLTTD